MQIKIATWNVNSIKVRLPKLIPWLLEHQPDVLALQETKIQNEKFPLQTFSEIGYHAIYNGEKFYNGVALITRAAPAIEIHDTLPLLDIADQKRFLAATYQGIRIVNLYVPNGQTIGSEKFIYKTKWFDCLQAYLAREIEKRTPTVILGDFNIAPEPLDVHEPLLWEDSVLFAPPVRNMFQKLLSLGFSDCFRQRHPDLEQFSWWDYRQGAFWKNHGLRIDHILMNQVDNFSCTECIIDRNARKGPIPSDHAPIIAQFTY